MRFEDLFSNHIPSEPPTNPSPPADNDVTMTSLLPNDEHLSPEQRRLAVSAAQFSPREPNNNSKDNSPVYPLAGLCQNAVGTDVSQPPGIEWYPSRGAVVFQLKDSVPPWGSKASSLNGGGVVDTEGAKKGAGSAKMPANWGLMLFVLNCGAMVLFFMMMGIYTGGVIRTIERRFGLRSQQTGVLSSLNDITHVCIVVFVGYFARKANKPRIMSVTILFSAVGGFIMASPHFLVPDGPRGGPRSANLTSQFCFAETFNETWADECWTTGANGTAVATTSADVHPAYYFFVFAQLISGVGSSAVFTLSLAYIDENLPTGKSSMYIGVLMSIYSLGPLCGFMLAAMTLSLPENLSEGGSETPDDPTFIGNWWLGYVICSTALVLLAVPMWFFPTRLASAPPPDPSRDTGRRREVQGFRQQWKEFPRDLMHLLKNHLFLVNLVSVVCGAYIVMGIFVNLVRYIEIHFHASASFGSIIAALVMALAGCLGALTGGVLMSRLKLKPTGAIKLMMFSSATFCVGVVIILNLGCPQVKVAGDVNPANGLITVQNACNAPCGCGTTRKHYSPVCANDDLTYFSSCFAGCTTFNNGTYSDCACTGGGTARPGLCKPHCYYLIPFAVTLFTMSIIGALSRVPATIVNFRIVDDDERSFALGINSFMINLIGKSALIATIILGSLRFIPAPILFGTLIDSTCRLWQSTCGRTGACLLFDTKRFRELTYGVALGFELLDLSFVVLLFFLVKRSNLVFVPLSAIASSKQSGGKDEEKNEVKVLASAEKNEVKGLINGEKSAVKGLTNGERNEANASTNEKRRENEEGWSSGEAEALIRTSDV